MNKPAAIILLASATAPQDGGDDQTCVSKLTAASSSSEVLRTTDGDTSSLNGAAGSTSDFRFILRSLKLFGRNEQLKILRDAFGSISATKSAEICFVHGESGVGKSRLTEALRDSVFEKEGFFVTGKFDQLSGNAPHSALQAAFSDLCDLIGGDNPDIISSLKTKLGDDARVLEGLIPSLKHMGLSGGTQRQDDSATVTTTGRLNAPTAYTRFKILCRTFLEAIASEVHPVVIVLDDLQWADEASIGMIENLVKVKHILIVASYRDGDFADGNIPLKSLLSSYQSSNFLVKYHDIALGALDLTSINEIVAQVTSREPEETILLSNVIFNKTHGNAYFCLQFLELLQMEGLLTLSKDLEWQWDIERIQNETNATDNVAAISTAKLLGIQPSTRLVLMYAAFLGYQIHPSLLQQIIELEKIAEGRGTALDELWRKAGEPSVAEALSIATTEGLLEWAGKDDLKFAHDSLQTCLLRDVIVHDDDIPMLHVRIGREIKRSLGEIDSQNDWMLFLSTDAMNKAQHLLNNTEAVDLIRQNLQCGEIAASKNAYVAAREYLRCAIGRLKPEDWIDNYELCLRVHEVSAEMEYCTGNSVQSKAIIDLVLKHAKDRKDTLRAFGTRVATLSAEAKLEEAVDAGFAALRQLNIRIPKPGRATLGHVVVEFVRTKRALKAYTFDGILRLPQMKDVEMLAAFNILSHVGLCAFHMQAKGKNCFTLIGLRAARLSLKFGLSTLATQAFAAYGAIVAILGNIEEGCKYSDLALQLSQKIAARETEARMLTLTIGFLQQWNTPLQDLHDTMIQAYATAMEHADVTYGLIMLVNYVDTSFLLGLHPMNELESHIHLFVELAAEYKMSHMLPSVLALHQAIINLMGDNSGNDPSRLNGDITNERELISMNERSRNDYSAGVVTFYRLMAAYHFENTLILEEVANQLERDHRGNEGHFIQRFMLFYLGLTYFLLFKRFGKRKHRRRAGKITEKFKSWFEKGYANSETMYKTLRMEQECDLWQDAIDSAERDHLGIPWAIACERAASITLSQNAEVCLEHVAMAIELYTQLEMQCKVSFLERRYRAILAPQVALLSSQSGNLHD